MMKFTPIVDIYKKKVADETVREISLLIYDWCKAWVYPIWIDFPQYMLNITESRSTFRTSTPKNTREYTKVEMEQTAEGRSGE